jgi:plastocyanin domain-containing protein
VICIDDKQLDVKMMKTIFYQIVKIVILYNFNKDKNKSKKEQTREKIQDTAEKR